MKSFIIFTFGIAFCFAIDQNYSDKDVVKRLLSITSTNKTNGLGQESNANYEEFYACPRCRRAAPKGPRKLPYIPPSDKSSSQNFV